MSDFAARLQRKIVEHRREQKRLAGPPKLPVRGPGTWERYRKPQPRWSKFFVGKPYPLREAAKILHISLRTLYHYRPGGAGKCARALPPGFRYLRGAGREAYIVRDA